MTVFKTYWKLLKRNLPLVILYTVILIGFAAANMKTNEKNLDFVASKPNIIVINQDELLHIYETRTRKIRIRCQLEVEKAKGDKINLVITENPDTMIAS